MLDVLPALESWRLRGESVAVATVVSTWGSAPRQVGSKLAITLGGAIAGSVSAGCVEGAVIEECRDALKTGRPRLLTYGVSDDTAFAVGLACGGEIRVFAEPFSAWAGIYEELRRSLEAREPLAVISVLRGGAALTNRKLIVFSDGRAGGDLPLAGQQGRAVREALSFLARGVGGTLELEDGTLLFVEVHPRPPRLILIGAVHIAEVLVPMAGLAGFDTIVVDPRGAFAAAERFPGATRLLKEWPGEALSGMSLDASAYVAVLTHDPKLDDPALRTALASGARYVGALGSRRTHLKRVERLRAAGVSDGQIARLHAPIGIPLGGRSPGEIAVSILAEIVRVKNEGPAGERPPAGP